MITQFNEKAAFEFLLSNFEFIAFTPML